MVKARGSPMRDCLLTKCVVAYVAIVSLSLSSLLAQEVPKSDDESFDIEPPLLVKPWEPQSARRTTRAKTQSRSMPPSSRSAWKERRKVRPPPHVWSKVECCQKSKRSSEHYASLGWSQSWQRRK